RPADLLSDRELLQIGAEIFGHAGVEADIQIIQMAMESVRRAGVGHARLDLNHPGVVRAVVEADPVLAAMADTITELLSMKDVPGITALGQQAEGVRADSIQALLVLANLYGGQEVITRARSAL